VPRHVEGPAIKAALAKLEGENRTRAALREGESLAEVFEKYGVL
jgi:hypothetical protein